MLDTKGPEIRTGFLENGKNVELQQDQILEIGNKNNIKKLKNQK